MTELCIVFSTADWRMQYWTNKQHTARLLARRGWRVLYVESVGLRAPSVASKRDWRRLWERLWRGLKALVVGAESVEDGIWVLPPLVLPAGHGRPLIHRLNQWLLRASLTRYLAAAGGTVRLTVWTYHPYMIEAIRGLPSPTLVYHCVDDLAAVPGVDAEAFTRQELRLLERCDAVFVTAPVLREKCELHNKGTYYFPNVVDFAHFSQALAPGALPPEVAAIPEPRLVYHGVLSDFKVDFRLLHRIAILRPDWHLVLIGEEREGQTSPEARDLKALGNVHFIGYRPYAALPRYLRGMHVGLLPTVVNDYTRGMFPMKFFEYLAAGLPVVSTSLDFARQGHAELLVADDEKSFVGAVERQLRRGRLSAEEARRAVGDNTWDTRMDAMMNILRQCAAFSSALPRGVASVRDTEAKI
jgi:glycosyltransferase involved in cell wall biosynthesis